MTAVYTLWLRNVKKYLRSKSRIIGSLAQPLFFLVILGFGLKSIALPGIQSNYLGFVFPGIIAMTILFTSIFSGIQVIWDKQFGFLKETLVAPVSRTSIMIGQTLGGATTSLIQGTLILILGLIITGTHINLLGIIVALVFMILIGLSLTAVGITIASRMEDMQGFQLIMNFLIMPLFLLSGALFPLSSAPKFLQILAYIDPVTYGVEGIRYGLLGTSQINPLICLLVLIAFTIVITVVGGISFRRIKL